MPDKIADGILYFMLAVVTLCFFALIAGLIYFSLSAL